MVRVGIVGAGNTIGISGMHIRGYKLVPEARITAVYDILRERAADCIAKYELEDAKACGSYEELLAEVDAVSICTPNASHIDLAVQALKAGKHVLCEKPFGIRAEECRQAQNYAEMSQKVCVIGLCYRGIPGFRLIKKLVDDGELGEILYVRQFLGGNRIADPSVKLEWRMQKALSGPGAMADFGSHMLDIGDMLVGDLAGSIVEVQCMSQTMVTARDRIGGAGKGFVDNDDVAVFAARTKKGALMSYTASRVGGRHTLELYGTGGCASFDGENPFSIQLQKKAKDGGYTGKPETIEAPAAWCQIGEEAIEEVFLINFYLEVKEFIEAIEYGTPVKTDFSRGVYIQRLIDALWEASESGQSVNVEFEQEAAGCE